MLTFSNKIAEETIEVILKDEDGNDVAARSLGTNGFVTTPLAEEVRIERTGGRVKVTIQTEARQDELSFDGGDPNDPPDEEGVGDGDSPERGLGVRNLTGAPMSYLETRTDSIPDRRRVSLDGGGIEIREEGGELALRIVADFLAN